MQKTEVATTQIVSGLSGRRGFMKNLGFASAALAGTAMLGTNLNAQEDEAPLTGITDVDIVQFALNLEYLEAEFYSVAGYGVTLEQRGLLPASAVGGPTLGGRRVALNSIAFIIHQIEIDEHQHVIFLRQALTSLGITPIKKPTINLDALGIGFNNEKDFLVLSRAFEDVGVSAYSGAAPLIKNPTILSIAARIALTEGQHSGAIRITCVEKGISVPPVDGKDVVPTPTKPFFVDNFGLSIPRSFDEVLDIVYHGGSTGGGFFPNGFNGKIKNA